MLTRVSQEHSKIEKSFCGSHTRCWKGWRSPPHASAQTISTFYIRGEFTNERRSLERAIDVARSIIAPIDIHVALGHGAYICGEETALIEALEGKRGMPRLKPPFPTERGFRNKPTLMHNVETACCIPAIIHRGGSWFKDRGKTEPGFKAVLRIGARPATWCLRATVRFNT